MTYLVFIIVILALVILVGLLYSAIKDSVSKRKLLRRYDRLDIARAAEAIGRARLNKMNKEYSWLLYKARQRKALQARKKKSFLKVIEGKEPRPVPNL